MLFYFQVLKKKLKEIKEGVSDLRFKISENSDRPKAIASMLQSFNISNMFIDSIAKMPDSSEIYTEKDVKDIKKIFAETKVDKLFMCCWLFWLEMFFFVAQNSCLGINGKRGTAGQI